MAIMFALLTVAALYVLLDGVHYALTGYHLFD
jgi:hypothetical protein